MEWSLFIISVLVLYGLWYGGNLFRDMILSSRSSRPSESMSFDMASLQLADKPVKVEDIRVPADPPEVAVKKSSRKTTLTKPLENHVTLMENHEETPETDTGKFTGKHRRP